jgi:hypothetical protein
MVRIRYKATFRGGFFGGTQKGDNQGTPPLAPICNQRAVIVI